MNLVGTFTYQPPSNFSGTDSFTYQPIDHTGQIGQTATVELVFKSKANNGEIFVLQNTTYYGFKLLDLCIGENLAIIPTQVNTEKGEGVQISSNGSFVYTPLRGSKGSDRFQYNFVLESSGFSTKRLIAPLNPQSSGIISVTILPLTPSSSGGNLLNFQGTIKKGKLLSKTTYKLEAKWSHVDSSDGGFYRIYSQGILIAEVPSGSPLVFSRCFDSKTLASNLEISFVYGNGVETSREKIVIQ